MRIIKPYVQTLTPPRPAEELYAEVELAGRTCYKSTRKAGEKAEDFIRRAIKVGHESILEHAKISLIFVCDRGVSHEIVRHRIASISQLSHFHHLGVGSTSSTKVPEFEEVPPLTNVHGHHDLSLQAVGQNSSSLLGAKSLVQHIEVGRLTELTGVLPHSVASTSFDQEVGLDNGDLSVELVLGVVAIPGALLAVGGLVCHYPAFFDDLKKAA